MLSPFGILAAIGGFGGFTARDFEVTALYVVVFLGIPIVLVTIVMIALEKLMGKYGRYAVTAVWAAPGLCLYVLVAAQSGTVDRYALTAVACIFGWAALWFIMAPRIYRIGFLLPAPRETPAVVAFFDELRRNGFIEGQNLLVIPGGFGVPNDQIASVAASLVAASPDVIIAGPELPLRALRQATQTIPLLGMTEDMVADGLVASFARPGGNITGISLLSPELDGKRQDILIEAVPGVRKIAVLADANVTSPKHLQELQEAAHGRGIEVLVRGVAKRGDVIDAINDVKASGAQAINFLATPMFSINAADFIRQVTSLRLPSIYQWPEDAEDGALIAYGPRLLEMYRERARIAVKVLRGAKPADIPVEQPTLFELVFNLKTAKAIGQEVPSGLLQRADKVIE